MAGFTTKSMILELTPNEKGLSLLALRQALAKEPTDLCRPDREIAEGLVFRYNILGDRPTEELPLDDEERVVLFAALEEATKSIAWHVSARGVLLSVMRKLEVQE